MHWSCARDVTVSGLISRIQTLPGYCQGTARVIPVYCQCIAKVLSRCSPRVLAGESTSPNRQFACKHSCKQSQHTQARLQRQNGRGCATSYQTCWPGYPYKLCLSVSLCLVLALFSPEMSVLIQKRHPHTGNINSETSGDKSTSK